MAGQTDVVVIGGGATGCGVARDLAMRGIDVTLVERGSLNGGTTGRSHGLLHSGARYADVDPGSATACREEGQILRHIAGAAVEDTGGYFVQLARDDGEYFETKRRACAECGIDVRPIDRDELLAREPALADGSARALAVPDAVVFPSRLVAATAASAREHGATICTGTAVTGIETGRSPSVQLSAADGGSRTITADHVVNATGAWAGRVAALAGIDLGMLPTRGLMVGFDQVGVESIINRCRPPTDGDIVVPHDDAIVCGTTSVSIEDPDDPGGDRSEVEAIRAECAGMLPALAAARPERTFWGVRPLFDAGGRGATRGFRVIDHGERDGEAGMTTVVGGKLTTYRRMAEATADAVVERLDLDRPCRTAAVPLLGHDDPARLDRLVAEFDASGPADVDVVGTGGD